MQTAVNCVSKLLVLVFPNVPDYSCPICQLLSCATLIYINRLSLLHNTVQYTKQRIYTVHIQQSRRGVMLRYVAKQVKLFVINTALQAYTIHVKIGTSLQLNTFSRSKLCSKYFRFKDYIGGLQPSFTWLLSIIYDTQFQTTKNL